MALVSTLTSSRSGLGALTSTSSSTGLSNIFIGAAIVIGALIFLLILSEVASSRESWNADTAAALRAICIPLIVTFCAFVVFTATQGV